MSTFYEELEVIPNASSEIIRAAYKSLIQRFHPDRNPGNRGSAQRTQRVNDAYAVLSDPERRAVYDAKLAYEARLNHEQQEARRRAADEATARAQAATAELQRDLEAAARAKAAARQKAAEAELERRQASDRDLQRETQATARDRAFQEIQARGRGATSTQSAPALPRYDPAKRPPKRSGFMRGVGILMFWGFGLWIAEEMMSTNSHAPVPPKGKSVSPAATTLAPRGEQTIACQMWMDGEQVIGDISIDFRGRTVDGKPAQISESTISFRLANDAIEVLSSIDRRTGVITTTSRDKAGRALTYRGHCALS